MVGESISGQVILNLSESLPETGLLIVHLKGVENILWQPNARGKNAVSNETTFLNERVGLFQFNNNVVPRGLYTFPFNVHVPQTM